MATKNGPGALREVFNVIGRVALPAAIVSIISLGAPVVAAPLTILTQPSEVVTVQVDEIEATASYTIVADRLELTMNFTEADGSSLNTRVMLADGQRYAVAFEGDDDDAAQAYFAFERHGQSIEVTTDSRGDATELAAR